MDVDRYPTSLRLSLLSLPPELRNYIYDLSIPSNKTFVVGPWRPSTRQMQPPLTRCCKQIRSEVLPMFVARNRFEVRPSTDIAREKSSMLISPLISNLLQHLEVNVCPFSTAYKVTIARDLQGIWVWNMQIYRDFHLPKNHVEVWSKWLENLAAHQDDDGCLRSEDLGIMIEWLQSWT